MDMFEIEIKYTKRGIFSSATCKENVRITLHDFELYEDRNAFNIKISKAINLLNNSNYWNTEIYIQGLQDYKVQKVFCLIVKDYKDDTNNTYTVYDYGNNSTDTPRFTKKELYSYIDDKLKKALENEVC